MNVIRKVLAGLICLSLTTIAFGQAPPAPTGAPVISTATVPSPLPEAVNLQTAAPAPPAEATAPAPEATTAPAATEPTPDSSSGPMATTTTATVAEARETTSPEVSIAQAVGTLTDPMTHIYISREFVFNLMVLANRLGSTSVQFNANNLDPIESQTGVSARSGNRATSTRSSGSNAYPESGGAYGAGEGGAGQQNTVNLRDLGDVDRTWLNAISVANNESLEKLLAAARKSRGWQRIARVQLSTREKQTLEREIIQIYAEAFRRANATGGGGGYGSPYGSGYSNYNPNTYTAYTPGMAPQPYNQPAPSVALQPTYQAVNPEMPNYQNPEMPNYQPSQYFATGTGQPDPNQPAPLPDGTMPPPDYSQPATAVPPPTPQGYPGQAYPGQGYPGQMYQAPPPGTDAESMASWYFHYQQMIGWERYIREETLRMRQREASERARQADQTVQGATGRNIERSRGVQIEGDSNRTRTIGPRDTGPSLDYEFDLALNPAQDLYLAPAGTVQPAATMPGGQPQAQEPMIHFDFREDDIARQISQIRPDKTDVATNQMLQVMNKRADEQAKQDSDRSRELVTRLDERKERRFRYREWQTDQTNELRRVAQDFQRRMAGDQLVIDDMTILISPEPLNYVPLNARNIVTERLTPYDLLDPNGALKRPPQETTERGPGR